MASKKVLTSEQQELYNELKKLSKRANQRLVRLERNFGENTWASKKLKARLESNPLQSWTSKGRVALRKDMTITQLRATIKATQQFLNSKTSTKRGITQVKKTTIKAIAQSMGVDGDNISDSEAEALYDMLSDDYVIDIIRFIPASELWALVEDAKEQNDTKEQFIDRIKDYIDFGNDVDMVNKLSVIYNRYVT